ncbi:HNH endonuclease [Gammaproteobacteria bacterium LSUCC0112]|nr:HNH endonuclease [Gammaproteobacteria bacterium LSUCC0112]
MSQLPSLTLIPADNAALSSEITRLAGHINAAQHRFLTLLAALIERDSWAGNGIKSPAHWLNYHCGIDLGAAREKVRVAKSLSTLPAIDEAFRFGTISYSKVRAMTRSATQENEQLLLRVALHGTAQHVEQLVRKFRRAESLTDDRRDQSRHHARELTCFFDDDGMLVLRGRMTPEDGAVFMKAMDAMFTAQNPPVNQDNDTAILPEKTFPQKRVDALLALAEQAMCTMEEGLQPLSSADKYQVVIHIEHGGEHGGKHGHEQHCTIESGAHHLPLSPATARRLCCDASLVPVLEDASGNVLNIRRKTRAIPPSIRRALQIRDHGCRFPGCCESRYVDAHHVQHWCDGGETRLDNLVLLCRHHHRLLHQDGYEIVKHGNQQFEFLTPAGGAMPAALVPQFATAAEDFATETLAIEREHEGIGLVIDSRTAVTRWQGERMDYDLAVGAMMRGPMLGVSAGR